MRGGAHGARRSTGPAASKGEPSAVFDIMDVGAWDPVSPSVGEVRVNDVRVPPGGARDSIAKECSAQGKEPGERQKSLPVVARAGLEELVREVVEEVNRSCLSTMGG